MKNAKYILLLVAAVVLMTGCRSRANDEAETEVPPEPTKYGIPYQQYEEVQAEVGRNETMSAIFGNYGLGAGAVYRIEQACRDSFDLRKVRAGNRYSAFVKTDTLGNNVLHHFVYEKNLTDYFVISLFGDSIAVRNGQKPVTTERCHATAEISSSLWNAIVDNNLPPALAADMEDIYGWSIDFFGIQPGDSFEVIYDQRYIDDTVRVNGGRIWGAVFHHGGRANYAIPFKQNGKLAYWDENGNSMRKQFLKAPLKSFSRISSKFSNSRRHPITRKYRPHHGVDYAAPTGTPVYAVADGTVTRKGWDSKGGGNIVWIKHARGYETGYLHLSRYATGLKVGSRVRQNDLIAYVGSTGSSTGPHLDYRVRLNGKPLDPLKMPHEPGEPIRKQDRELFAVVRDKIMGELAETLPEAEWLTNLDSIVIPTVTPAPVNPSPADTTANLIDGKKKK
jgi:murein DD-endopeptidase MepM/ murein hydrolase activator NlpD